MERAALYADAAFSGKCLTPNSQLPVCPSAGHNSGTCRRSAEKEAPSGRRGTLVAARIRKLRGHCDLNLLGEQY